jgi:hypothetical integral membrane protein (TIGR02206 family)
MEYFFTKEHPYGPFVLFDARHLTAIGIIILINLLIIIFRKRFSPRLKTAMRWGMAAILIIDEIGWHSWNFTTGQWNIQTMLPLHLCSVFVFLNSAMLILRNYSIYEFAYLLGISGALQAVLTPDAGQYGFPHFRFFQVFISHGFIITSAVFMTAVEGFRPTWKSIPRVLGWSAVYAAVVEVINFAIGSNYLFIARKPETASVLDVLPAWPWYLPIIFLFALACCLILYLPFAISDWRSRSVQPADTEL